MASNTLSNRSVSQRASDRLPRELQTRTAPIDPAQALEFSQLLQRNGEFERAQVLEREKDAAEQQARTELERRQPRRRLPASFMATGDHFLPDKTTDTTGTTSGGSPASPSEAAHQPQLAGSGETTSTGGFSLDKACEALYTQWSSPELSKADRTWTIELPQDGNGTARLHIERTAGNEWIVRVSQDSAQGQGDCTAGDQDAESVTPELQKLCDELQTRLNASEYGDSCSNAHQR